MTPNRLNQERQHLDNLLRTFVGKDAIASSSRAEMLVYVESIEITDEGWWATLSDGSGRGEPWKIGFFRWDEPGDFSVNDHRWSFPTLGERYEFDPKAVEAFRLGNRR